MISIGWQAFSSCSGLTHVTIGNGTTTIGTSAFYGCSGLVDVVIGDAVTTIGQQAFYDCSSLTTVIMGSSVSQIDEDAFYRCNSLWHVLYRGTEEQWNAISIGKYNSSLQNATRHYECTGDEVVDVTNKICVLCCEHSRGEAVEVPPTCTEDGYTGYLCTLCGTTVKEVILPAGNSFGDWTVDLEPTCTEPGSKKRICSACGATETEWISALGHNFGEWITDQAPACTEPGSKHHVCAACGAVETAKIPATGHTYEDGICHCGDINWPLSGQCGDDLTWTLTADGLLTISGTGKMWDFAWDDAHWRADRAYIKQVVIEDGVTSIGKSAFFSCRNLDSVTIGAQAF